MTERATCPNPENCCRELSRVWTALDIGSYTGQSASEHVTDLRARLAASEQARQMDTESEQARQQTLQERLREMTPWYTGEFGWQFCRFCGVPDDLRHTADCLWAQAQESPR